jgi:hypothetical protein
MERFLLSMWLALWPATASFAQAPVTIDLGSSKDVAVLYSFPNNCDKFCLLDQTLFETIEKYLRASLARDGFGDTTVTASESAGRIYVRLAGTGASPYANALPAYLSAGSLGLKGARELLTALGPDGHPLWRYNWHFFLPHGVAMVRHRTVQLLHFPPDNVPMDLQDYLKANTTKRWADLLVKNGAAPNDVDRFQNIIDIAPIALPDRDSCYLDPRPPCATNSPATQRSGVYPHFDNYVTKLLNLWLPLPGQIGSRPLIAFGRPVRDWLKANYNVDLPPLKLGIVTLESGMRVPTLAANHPSYIWHVKDMPQSQQLGQAMGIMRQDLTAACWEVKMGMDATASPESTLSICTQTWSGQDKELCELSYTQVFDKTLDEAKQLCANVAIRASSDAEIDASAMHE